MNLEEFATKYKDAHPGYILSDWYYAAIPAYLLQIRAQMLGAEPLPPVEQFILKCLDAGLDTSKQISGALGLPQIVLVAALENLEKQGCVIIIPARDQDSEKIRITQKGRRLLSELSLQIPREETFSICQDGLTGEFFPFRHLLTPKVVNENGFYPVPFFIDTPKEAHLDLFALKQQWRLGLRSLPKDMQTLELLDIIKLEKVIPGYRVMRVLQFIHQSSHTVLAHVYDGVEQSASHENALLEMENRGIHALRGERKPADFIENQLPDPVEKILPKEIIQVARRKAAEVPRLVSQIEVIKTEVEKLDLKVKESESLEEQSLAEQEADNLRAQISDLQNQIKRLNNAVPTVEVLSMIEHRPKLLQALREAKEQAIIVSPWLTLDAVNRELLDLIRDAVRRNVKVWIGYGFGESKYIEKKALEKLKEIQDSRFGRNLIIKNFGCSHAKVLICDEEFMVTTSFNWLSFAGREDWGNRVEFGTLVRDRKAIKMMIHHLMPLFGEKLDRSSGEGPNPMLNNQSLEASDKQSTNAIDPRELSSISKHKGPFVFIGNLPYDTTCEDLRVLLDDYGEVIDAAFIPALQADCISAVVKLQNRTSAKKERIGNVEKLSDIQVGGQSLFVRKVMTIDEAIRINSSPLPINRVCNIGYQNKKHGRRYDIEKIVQIYAEEYERYEKYLEQANVSYAHEYSYEEPSFIEENCKTEMRRCLFIDNLPDSFNEEDISHLFSSAGEVISVELFREADTLRSLGCGMVQVGNEVDINSVINRFQGEKVKGQVIELFLVDSQQDAYQLAKTPREARKSFMNYLEKGEDPASLSSDSSDNSAYSDNGEDIFDHLKRKNLSLLFIDNVVLDQQRLREQLQRFGSLYKFKWISDLSG